VFVRMREVLVTDKDLARHIDVLEAKLEVQRLFEAIGELMTPPEPRRRPIGFVTPKEK
jgi:hypothetical protein